MLVGAYGMFWLRDEVDWNPGSGPNAWSLLGRVGERRPKLRVVDFRRARGVYILFGDHGAHYVGLARGVGGIGERLQAHTRNDHKNAWQRFCWFSFDRVGSRRNTPGLTMLERRDKPVPANGEEVIREMEALLITVLGARGQNVMKFAAAECWEQIAFYDSDNYLARVAPR